MVLCLHRDNLLLFVSTVVHNKLNTAEFFVLFADQFLFFVDSDSYHKQLTTITY